MATVTNLSTGSKGSDVKKLQQALIDAGYDVGKTGADGVFGKNTLAAVKQYQKDNGLAVDGIAGKNTQGKLYGASATKPLPSKTPSTTQTNTGTKTETKTDKGTAGTNAGAAPSTDTEPLVTGPVTSPGGNTYGDFIYPSFNAQDDPLIQQANDLLQQHINSKPGSYTPVWQDEADAYLSQYQNRDPFSYDFNSDALYNQYKDQYIQQGRLAMMDTMGQAAAMTGGYGSSYAQTAGQQAYNQQLNHLNDVMPELYGMALDRYTQEGQELLDMYGMYMDREALEYGKYQDGLNNWYTQLGLLTDNYNTQYSRGWDEYALGYNTYLNEYNTDRSEKFTTKENDKNRLIDLMTSTGYEPTDSELAAVGLTKEQAKGYKDVYTNSLKTGSNGGNGGTTQYKELVPGSTEYLYITKNIMKAEDLEDLHAITLEYKGYGYDIANMAVFKQKLAELSPKDGPAVDTTVTPTTDPWKEEQAKRRSAAAAGKNKIERTFK